MAGDRTMKYHGTDESFFVTIMKHRKKVCQLQALMKARHRFFRASAACGVFKKETHELSNTVGKLRKTVETMGLLHELDMIRHLCLVRSTPQAPSTMTAKPKATIEKRIETEHLSYIFRATKSWRTGMIIHDESDRLPYWKLLAHSTAYGDFYNLLKERDQFMMEKCSDANSWEPTPSWGRDLFAMFNIFRAARHKVRDMGLDEQLRDISQYFHRLMVLYLLTQASTSGIGDTSLGPGDGDAELQDRTEKMKYKAPRPLMKKQVPEGL
ncbi:MAG: hypothetical protein Q9174_005253, partial [Haloplaca sp. 1 TL-2023]